MIKLNTSRWQRHYKYSHNNYIIAINFYGEAWINRHKWYCLDKYKITVPPGIHYNHLVNDNKDPDILIFQNPFREINYFSLRTHHATQIPST